MALDLYTCLRDIVGLSENDCDCYGTDAVVLSGLNDTDVWVSLDSPDGGEIVTERPADWNKSLSGLYMDDPKFSIPLKFTGNTKDCGEGNVWDILLKARKHGLRNFITDLSAGMRDSYYHKLNKFNGYTAGTSHNYTVTNLGAISGVYLDPVQYKGAKGIINFIELYVQGSGTFEVNIYDENDLATPVNENPISVSVANNFGKTKLTEPLTLSFSDEYGRKVGYYIVYDRSGSDPRNLPFGCNCGNDKPWQDHFMLYGVSADAVSNLESASKTTQYPNGIRMHMDVTCGMDWLCRTWDFSRDWDRVASEAIMIYGVCELLERQLIDPQPVASADPDMVKEKLTNNRTLLSRRMPWLAANVPMEESDCYVCKGIYEVDEILI